MPLFELTWRDDAWFLAGVLAGILYARPRIIIRAHRMAEVRIREIRPTTYLVILVLTFVSIILAGCRPSQLMRVQCPESPRTYCPAQHPLDTARRGGR